MNPIATIQMQNGKKIVIELLPSIAPNAVKSFIYLAQKKIYDNHSIERIVPGSWVDVSYTAFGSEDAKYWIKNDLDNEDISQRPKVDLGTVIMGGYEDRCVSGGEFVFPLARCNQLDERYPVFGIVKEGIEELQRLEKVATYPIEYKYPPFYEINCPKNPEIIEFIEVDTYGAEYQEPEKIGIPKEKIPKAWIEKIC